MYYYDPVTVKYQLCMIFSCVTLKDVLVHLCERASLYVKPQLIPFFYFFLFFSCLTSVMTDLANTFYNPGHCEQLPLC